MSIQLERRVVALEKIVQDQAKQIAAMQEQKPQEKPRETLKIKK